MCPHFSKSGDEKMEKVLLLATGWQSDYWELPKEAPYPKMKYTNLPEWDDLSKSCPLPGIGRYIKQKDKDFSQNAFVYLEITGMRYDSTTEEPYFNFKTLTKSKIKSCILEDKLPSDNRKLFSVIEPEKLFRILQDIDEEPPEEWKKLIEIKEEIIHWRDYIGKYFLDIEEMTLSNNEFEDRVAALLNALGFGVVQKGHKIIGEYADGIASFGNDYAIVYDCKNTQNFFPCAVDERAIKKYLDDEKKIRSERNIYCAFIAKSFKEESRKDMFYLPITTLLYLLYKKLSLGSKFTLSPLKKILDNFTPLRKETTDKEWMK